MQHPAPGTPSREKPLNVECWALKFKWTIPTRYLFTATVSVALLSFAFSQQPLSPNEIKELLARIRQKRTAAPFLQANFQEERVVHLMNRPIVSSGKVWFRLPNEFRREVRGSSSSVTVCDGQQLWIYYPNFKSAEHYSLSKRSPVNAGIAAVTATLNLENVEATYQITGVKLKEGYELELVPRTPSLKRMFQRFRFRMNNELFVTETEILQPDGDRIITRYSSHSAEPISQSTFEFAPPPGTEVTTPLGR
jgi:outer membrane lipoprotein-sorting protein